MFYARRFLKEEKRRTNEKMSRKIKLSNLRNKRPYDFCPPNKREVQLLFDFMQDK